MDIMAAILGLLEHPQTQQQQCCDVLSLVSQVLQTPRFESLHSHVDNSSVSQGENLEELECSMAADAFPSVLSRLDDRSDDVRRKAIQTLGDFLPFVQPDSTGRERSSAEVEGEPDAENITDGNVAPATSANDR